MKPWEVLDEKIICDSHWFRLFKQKVKTRDSNIIEDFYFGSLGKVVNILPILKTGEIVLVRQYRHATKKIMLELPAGIVEQGREIEDTVVNELEEEVGIKVSRKDLISLGKSIPVPHKLDMTVYSFLAKDLEFNSKQSLESNEDIEVVALKSDKVWDMIKEGGISQSDTLGVLLKARLYGYLAV